MALGYIDDGVFEDIADAIREKGGAEGTLAPDEMAEAIGNISGGGGFISTSCSAQKINPETRNVSTTVNINIDTSVEIGEDE